MPSEILSDSDYALLVESCGSLPAPRGDYAIQDFISILILTVLDYQLHNTVVDRAHTHFRKLHAPGLPTITSLSDYLSSFPDSKEGNTAAALALWNYKHWTRLAQLRRLVSYFQSIDISDKESLRRWAEKADFKRDFKGRVKGLGPAVFQWLVMRAGVETIKPDVHVLNFISSVIGHRPTFDIAVRTLESVALAIGRTPRELDLAIWEAQRGGPGQV
jgi:hypothetical protein